MMAAEEVVSKAGDGLSKKVGPLPIGVWILAIGAGLAVSFYLSRKKGGAPVSPAPSNVGSGTGPGGTLVPQMPAPTPTPTPDSKPQTNTQWARLAKTYLLAKNYDPLLVESAINDFLFSKSLTPNEQAIVNEAIRGVGAPPEILQPKGPPPPDQGIPNPEPDTPPPPPDNTPTPPPPPDNPPPAPQYKDTFVVQPWPAQGSTLWGIATIEYGNGGRWPDIYNANRDKISNPDLIYPGQALVIPW